MEGIEWGNKFPERAVQDRTGCGGRVAVLYHIVFTGLLAEGSKVAGADKASYNNLLAKTISSKKRRKTICGKRTL